MKTKKIVIMLVVIMILMADALVLANTNEKVILKNSNNEYLIYYEEFCNKEFQFAISVNKSAKIADLNFINSATDQPEQEAEALNVAYIDKASFEKIFGENPTSLIAYIWVKDANDNIAMEADEINLEDALTDEIIALVDTTTKVNEKTDRIEIDTTKQHITHPEVEGVTTTVTTGKIVVKENEGSQYYYNLIKVDDENKEAKEMYNLAEKMAKNDETNTYERLLLEKKFYELYKGLIPEKTDWTEIENSEILQPETARSGDKYIVYIKETNGEKEIIDAKLLISKYDFEEKRIDEEDKIIKETVKLPVTFDRGAVLFTLLGVMLIALIIFIVLRKRLNKKTESK